MAVSNRDRAYFARLGAFKVSSHAAVTSDHQALPLAERLARSWALFETFRETANPTQDDAGPLAFYKRARVLGLIRR